MKTVMAARNDSPMSGREAESLLAIGRQDGRKWRVSFHRMPFLGEWLAEVWLAGGERRATAHVWLERCVDNPAEGGLAKTRAITAVIGQDGSVLDADPSLAFYSDDI